MLNKIGFFQLDNLIQSRVPFLLLNMGADISSWFISIFKDHLSRNQVLLKPEQLMQELNSKNVSKDAAIVLLCEDGLTSLQKFTDLEKKGYTNVYVVNGGYQQMMTERNSS